MTYNDIKSKVYLLTKTNSTSFPNDDLVILANNALDRVTSLILQADGRWQWDDTNQTDLPIATTNLVSGQQDYSLSVDHIEIQRVEAKDSNGNWYLLKPLDKAEIKIALNEYFDTDDTPRYYDKVGNSVFLYPAPNYSQSASLKLYFSRPASYFVSGDTTKKPGFNALFHDLIPLWVAYDYGLANGLSNVNLLMQEIQRKETELLESYQKRSKDEPLRFRTPYNNPR